MTYATVEQLRGYAGARGYALPDADAECARLLTLGHDWLELQEWAGSRTDADQVNEWPRTGAYVDGRYLPSDSVPKRVIDAECQLAVDSMSFDLLPTGEGREVVKERVEGIIDLEYATNGSGAVVPEPTKAKALIRPLLASGGMTLRVCRA
ncbi:hypothetical protein GCM10023116_43620 [Kistimonas scapharcae]|uniref:Putative DnaT-like domain-containing protein n=1 Tax=Kistimonas scapharcae TaxID=1036133 RepID=A0ABP8V765_9GAMM